jgi:hypothetical protein
MAVSPVPPEERRTPSDVGPAWGGAEVDPDLELPAPTGAGRLALVAHRPWPGVSVTVEALGARIACALADRVVLGSLPDLGPGQEIRLRGVAQVAFVPGRRWLCAAGDGRALVLALDRPRGSAPPLDVRTRGAVRMAPSPGGTLLALVGRVSRPRGTLGVWDLDRRAQAWSARPFGAACAAWVDGRILAVGGRDLRLYGHDGAALPARGAPGVPLEALAADPSALVSAGRGATATLWNAARVAPAASLPVPAGAGRTLAVADGTLAAGTVRAGGAVALVGLERRTVDRVLLGMRAAAFAGPWLVVTGPAGTAVLEWDPAG